MSGFVMVPPIPIPIVEFPALILLLGSLGYEMIRGYRSIQATRTGWVEGSVFRSANGVEVEVGITEDGSLQLHVDKEELREKEGIEEEQLAGKIVQGYTYKKVIDKLQSQGFTLVEEEELDSGTIKLVVRRWS